MDAYIQKLNISSTVKAALHNTGFTKLSELEGHNYITLAEILPPNCNLERIIEELNLLGYLLPPENEISIYEITISKRLLHILQRNNIIYLSQLSSRPKEEILRFRNMGEKTIEELESICNKYNIHIRSINFLKDTMSQYEFPAKIFPTLFKHNISKIDDFRHRDSNDLYNICGKDFSLTMKIYFILKKNAIELQKGREVYFFEILSQKESTVLWHKLNITTVSQLRDYDKKKLNKIISCTPSLAMLLNALL